jgi:Lar family restriction alleviation protein
MRSGKKKVDIVPCAYCGGEKVYVGDNGLGEHYEKPDVFWVVCETCGASGPPRDSKREAIEGWNTRMPMEIFVHLNGQNGHKATDTTETTKKK